MKEKKYLKIKGKKNDMTNYVKEIWEKKSLNHSEKIWMK